MHDNSKRVVLTENLRSVVLYLEQSCMIVFSKYIFQVEYRICTRLVYIHV